MSYSKRDRDLVASKENKGSELKYLTSKWQIGIKELRAILLEISGTDRPARSREEIERVLVEKEYKLRLKKGKAIEEQQ